MLLAFYNILDLDVANGNLSKWFLSFFNSHSIKTGLVIASFHLNPESLKSYY